MAITETAQQIAKQINEKDAFDSIYNEKEDENPNTRVSATQSVCKGGPGVLIMLTEAALNYNEIA